MNELHEGRGLQTLAWASQRMFKRDEGQLQILIVPKLCLASADIEQNVLYGNGIQILLIIYFKRDTQRGKDTDRQRETDRQTDTQRQRERQNTEYGKGYSPICTINLIIQYTHSIQVADVVMLQMSKTEARPYVEENSYNNFLDY